MDYIKAVWAEHKVLVVAVVVVGMVVVNYVF